MFPAGGIDLFRNILGSWYESVKNPENFQNRVMLELLEGYDGTEYGKKHNSSQTTDISSFRANFPTVNYKKLNPFLADAQKGNYSAILPEPLVCWVMTRGSTGPSKVLPATKTHLEQIFTCGARALANYVYKKRDLALISGHVLNLNFPSNVHSITMHGKETTYGYSSGTYARLNPMLNQISLLPRQEQIDALGSGITRADWEKRFDLAYELSLGKNLTAAMGVTPVILSFARYIKRKYGKNPKDLWKFRALFCTSVRKIQFKYAPVLRKLFGRFPSSKCTAPLKEFSLNKLMTFHM